MAAKHWWGKRDAVSARLRLEVEAVRNHFEKTFRLVVPKWGLLYWTGDVEINMRDVPQRVHKIKILYPNDYPARPPEAYVLEPEIVSQKHQFTDGQLCLFNPKDGKTYGWNPARSTAATVIGWAVEWLYAYYTWQATGDWPGIEEEIKEETEGGR